MTIDLPPPGGRLVGITHYFPVRVYYEDTDLSGIVYHANYLKWFERARSDLLRLIGIDQRAAQECGEGAYAVAELSIRYASPARLDDAVVIASRPTELRAASCRLHQQARRGEESLAEAHLRIGFVGTDGRPRRQPDAWRAAFAQLMTENETA
jgi:acyl-CoA thioester hydrolase